jgi:methanogenic corrinoid protein MtbC1/DNA-binding XRE family transcriptional regulator
MARRRKLDSTQGSGALDQRYLTAVVRGDAAAAAGVVAQAQARGWNVERIYLRLFAPTLAAIGARWRAGTLSVADEHLATEITVAEMDRVRDSVIARAASGRHVVVACIEGEAHAIGARMLTDLLRIDGWSVDYLGANTPTADLVDFVARRRPALVALSVTQAEHVAAVRVAAASLRRLVPPPRILAGGAAFGGRAHAAIPGVDAVASDARAGVQQAQRLFVSTTKPIPPADEYFERLGRRIQELRTAKGWKQQQLADEAGLDRTYISGLEHGKQNPSLGALFRLTRALDISLARLVIPDAP